MARARLLAGLLERGFVLAATAFPGLQRILQLALVQHFAGAEQLGRFASDVAIINLIGLFTAIGASALLMTRVPALRGARQSQLLLGVAARAAGATLLGALVLGGLGAAGLVFDAPQSIVLLAGWSGYQLYRHFLLARQRYRRIVLLESLLIVAMAAIMALPIGAPATLAYLSFGLPSLALTLLMLAVAARDLGRAGYRWLVPQRRVLATSAEFALINLISGGMQMMLVPLCVQLAGPRYGGLLGLLASGLNVLVLFPRALSLNNLPLLARAVQAGETDVVARTLKRFRSQLLQVDLAVSVPACAAWFVAGALLVPQQHALPGAQPIFVLMLLTFLASQMVLPESNYLQVVENTRFPLLANGVTFALFALAAAVLLVARLPAVTAVEVLCSMLLLVTLGRNVWLRRFVAGRYAVFTARTAPPALAGETAA